MSLKDTSFHISINSIGFYLSPECLLNCLSNFYIPPRVGKVFKLMEFPISRKCIDSRHFYLCLSPLKTQPQVLVITPKAEGNYSFPQVAIFQKSVAPSSRKRSRKDIIICFIKFQSENLKMSWNIRFFIFCMIWNFF